MPEEISRAARQPRRAATAASPASPGAPPRRPAGSWAWAASPTPARTAPSCSSRARHEPRIPARVRRAGRAACAISPPRATRATCAGCGSGSRTRGRSPPSTGAACRTRTPRDAARGRGRSEAEARGLRHPLGPQGARGPPAGPDRQGPGRRASCVAPTAERRAVRRRRRHRPRRLRRARSLVAERRPRRGGARGRRAPTKARPRSWSGRTWWSKASTASPRARGARRGLCVRRLPAGRGAPLRGGGHGAARSCRSRARANDDDRARCSWRSPGGSRPRDRPLARPPARPRPRASRGLLSDARTTPSLPELEPGARAVQPAVGAGPGDRRRRRRSAFFVPAGARDRRRLHAAGGALRGATSRGAVLAIEERDGVASSRARLAVQADRAACGPRAAQERAATRRR